MKGIITYQEKLGNYNWNINTSRTRSIITYQEKLGNYNYDYSKAVNWEL